MKIGTVWEIKNYRLYKNDYGKLEKSDADAGPFFLSYEVTDMKKSNVKNFYIIALTVTWTYGLNSNVEYSIGIYDKINKIIKVIEPETNSSKFGFVDLSILKNGKLRVKYIDEDMYGYVVDLCKMK
jgi:hypothetical protein